MLLEIELFKKKGEEEKEKKIKIALSLGYPNIPISTTKDVMFL